MKKGKIAGFNYLIETIEVRILVATVSSLVWCYCKPADKAALQALLLTMAKMFSE